MIYSVLRIEKRLRHGKSKSKNVMEFLRRKFGDRIISRFATHIWPASSPDLNPMDFSFWGQAMSHVSRCQPKTINQLKTIVEDFAANMDEEMVRKMARSVYGRSKLCIEQGGGHFEHLKAKASRKLN